MYMFNYNYSIINESSIDKDEHFQILIKSEKLLKKYDIKIKKYVDDDLLNIICEYYGNKFMESEKKYIAIIEKLKEESHFEFFFKKNSEESIDYDRLPDITLDILEIDHDNLEVKFLPYSSLYKSVNKSVYPTISCKFDLLDGVVSNGLDLGNLLLDYSQQLISNILDEEKNDPNIYSKNDIVGTVMDGGDDDREYLNDTVFFGKSNKALDALNFI